MKKQLSYGKLSLLIKDSSLGNNLLKRKEFVGLLKNTLPILENFLSRDLLLQGKCTQMEFSLSFCGFFKIRCLNKIYRKKDKITDVLAFPLHENLSFPKVLPPVLHLGDVFICRPRACQQSGEFGRSFDDECLHLLIHGFLHLTGMDHEISIQEAKHMESWEKKLKLNILNQSFPPCDG